MQRECSWWGAMTLVALSGAGCGATTRAGTSESAQTYDASSDVAAREPEASERLFPPCHEGGAPPEFPSKTEGAAYRAIVHFRISAAGKPEQPCFARVEGPLDLERKALADREQWTFPVEQAGQRRERIVFYKLLPPGAAPEPAAPLAASPSSDAAVTPTPVVDKEQAVEEPKKSFETPPEPALAPKKTD